MSDCSWDLSPVSDSTIPISCATPAGGNTLQICVDVGDFRVLQDSSENTRMRCVTAASLALTLVALAAETPRADAANGKRLYMTYGVMNATGTTGRRRRHRRPRIAPNPLPLLGVKSKLRTASGRMPVLPELS